MTKDEALRLALEAFEMFCEHGAILRPIETRDAIKAALEAKDEKDSSPCPEFWDWLPKAYRNGDADDLPKFTKYNMEVAFLAGKQSVALEAKDEPVAWMRTSGTGSPVVTEELLVEMPEMRWNFQQPLYKKEKL
jgi:hypothetical protein